MYEFWNEKYENLTTESGDCLVLFKIVFSQLYKWLKYQSLFN